MIDNYVDLKNSLFLVVFYDGYRKLWKMSNLPILTPIISAHKA